MPYLLGEIAEQIGAELYGDPASKIHGISTLENANKGQISFLSNRRYAGFLKTTRASAVILSKEDRPLCPVDALVVDDPYLGFARVARLFHQEKTFSPGIHPTACIGSTAEVHPSACIGPHVSIGERAGIAEDVIIGPGCVIGDNVRVGAGTRLHARVVLYDGVKTGSGVILHSGAVIGADGFGIANDGGKWLKIPQSGSVIIGNDVEIGANTTIDRGALEDTIIEDGVKIDNQVQVGHNVHIGAHTAIAGCVAIAGSTRIGKHCIIGGACGISGHIEICDGVMLMAMTGVANSIREPGVYGSGMPALDVKLWRKNLAVFKRLHELNKRIRKLEND